MNRAERRRQAKLDRKSVIKPFMIRGDIVDNHVAFDTSNLEHNQAKFVNGCTKALNQGIIDQVKTIDPADAFVHVMYNDDEDFGAGISSGLTCSPDEGYTEMRMLFDKHHSEYPQIGFTYTRDEMLELTPLAGSFIDNMNQDGIWPWLDARATFQKKGDLMVVIDTMEVA